MSDTSKRGVPVRFHIMPGGTNPTAMVSLAEVLATLIEPHPTADEHRIREGLPVVDDYDWDRPQGNTEDSVDPDSAGVHEAPSMNTTLPTALLFPVPGMAVSGDSSTGFKPAPRGPENPGETNVATPVVTPSEIREIPTTDILRIKEILVPITPGTNPGRAERDIQW